MLVRVLSVNISIPDCQLLQNVPYNIFWDKIKDIGTPIIEPLQENTAYCRVTFLYQSTTPIQNVVLATYGLGSYDPRYDQLTHIPGTDIYYKSYILPSQTRTIYCFSPNDPIISLAECDLHNCTNLATATQNWQSDVFNKNPYTIPGWLVLGDTDKHFSLLELPGAPDHSIWIKKPNGIPVGKISSHVINRKYIDSSRTVHIYIPNHPVEKSYRYPLLTFFDGDAYLEFTSAANILDNLIYAKKIPPVMAVFISNPPPNSITRWIDYACNEKYTTFVAKELIPWAQTHFHASTDPRDNSIIGASFGGLAALFLGLKYSETVGNVISQSGFFSWRPQNDLENGWLMREFIKSPKQNLKCYLDIGSLETALTFNNGASLLSTNRHMRDVLKAKGYDVLYTEYAGGHDYICWQNTLPNALLNFYAESHS